MHRQRIVLFFLGVQKTFTIWNFPSRVPMKLSRIAFPMIVLSEDRTDFAQEERLGLPCWTMIWAICVLVDVSKYLDILSLEFSITMVHLSFRPGCKLILRM